MASSDQPEVGFVDRRQRFGVEKLGRLSGSGDSPVLECEHRVRRGDRAVEVVGHRDDREAVFEVQAVKQVQDLYLVLSLKTPIL